MSIEIDDDFGLEVDSITEVFDRNFRSLREANLVHKEYRRPVIRTRALKLVNQVFGIAEIGEIWRRRDHDMIRAKHDLLRPCAPQMRYVNGDPGDIVAHDIEHLFTAGGLKIVRPIEGARSGE